MKTIPIIFSVMVVTALSLTSPICLRADGITAQPVPANPQQNSTSSVNGSATVGQNGSYGGAFAPEQYRYPAPVNKASVLIGTKVKNQNNETLGKIKDIVIDLPSGKVAYVVLEKAGRTHGTGPDISVPLSAFTPTSDNRYLVLNSSKSQVQNAWGFSVGNYPPMGSPVYGAQPAGQQEPIREHIIVVPVPVPVSPDQDKDLSPDQKQQPDTSPDSDTDHSY